MMVAARLRPIAPLLVATAFAGAASLAGCADRKPDAACERYSTVRHALEGAPDCDFRSPHTLINGLPPAHPWNHS